MFCVFTGNDPPKWSFAGFKWQKELWKPIETTSIEQKWAQHSLADYGFLFQKINRKRAKSLALGPWRPTPFWCLWSMLGNWFNPHGDYPGKPKGPKFVGYSKEIKPGIQYIFREFPSFRFGLFDGLWKSITNRFWEEIKKKIKHLSDLEKSF